MNSNVKEPKVGVKRRKYESMFLLPVTQEIYIQSITISTCGVPGSHYSPLGLRLAVKLYYSFLVTKCWQCMYASRLGVIQT